VVRGGSFDPGAGDLGCGASRSAVSAQTGHDTGTDVVSLNDQRSGCTVGASPSRPHSRVVPGIRHPVVPSGGENVTSLLHGGLPVDPIGLCGSPVLGVQVDQRRAILLAPAPGTRACYTRCS